MEGIVCRLGHDSYEHPLFGNRDLVDGLDRDQQKLAPESPSANFEQVRLIDPGAEAQSLDEADGAVW